MILAVAAGLVAGVLYYAGAQRIGVVVAASDLAPGHPIAAADLEIRAMPPDALPSGAVTDPSAAIGRFARTPIWKGQLLLAAAISTSPAAFQSGIELPTGYRAVAIPVSAAHAVGGALIPGSRVDVISVPVQGRAPAGRGTELIAQAALVVDVRGEQGGPFERLPTAPRAATAIRDRLGSVVIAVGPVAQMWIADRIATSTFVLALVADRP
ncbi:MAG: Flp pilus assembly protein CpaB [Chloroflexi bacterium]|nr:Flp pilus assembly protein CpaB [Chloroflexota bacterium]